MKTIAFQRARTLLALGTTAVVFVVLTFFLTSPIQSAPALMPSPVAPEPISHASYMTLTTYSIILKRGGGLCERMA